MIGSPSLQVYSQPAVIDFSLMHGRCIIGIDGDQGAGKTTLAATIQSALNGNLVSVDDYLRGDGDPYLTQIDQERLVEALRRDGAPIIVEGVLLLDALDAVGVVPDFYIFAKRIVEGHWLYSDYLLENATLPRARLTREIANYYIRRRPFSQADLEVSLFIVSLKRRRQGV